MTKLLIVEDESVIRSALKRLLERNDYDVSEAGSVQEAETSFDLQSFDLIISDLRLPGAAGTTLIKKAGAVPVLIMTSYASLKSAVDSMRMGAVDYIAKPFDHGDMINAVERILKDNAEANTKHKKALNIWGRRRRAWKALLAIAKRCKICATISPRWLRLPQPCSFWGKPAPARKWWLAAYTNKAIVPPNP